MARILIPSLILLSLSGCVGPAPHQDYVLANTAILAAQSAEAPQYAPGLFIKAQEYYRKAQQSYSDRDYSDARDDFKNARIFAEKAENYTMLKKAQNGDAN